jgi:hypothetical protein
MASTKSVSAAPARLIGGFLIVFAPAVLFRLERKNVMNQHTATKHEIVQTSARKLVRTLLNKAGK